MRFRLDLALYLLSAIFAGITARTSTLEPHRVWGGIAVWGYLGATVALLILRERHRALLAWVTWVAVAVIPLLVLAVRHQYQEEVFVVEESARRLLHTGTPYLTRDAIAALPEPLLGYTPYQPGMAVFGVPKALFGSYWWTDARIYFAITLAGCVAGALHLLRGRPGRVLALQMATVLPICALTLATGGDDMPVLGLCLLALALAAVRRPGWAGVAIGAAAAMKLFAWPVAIVLALLLRNRHYLIAALGLPLLALVPPLLVDAGALVENVIRFPAGHGLVTSPAASPLLGKVIADGIPDGRLYALALLGLAGAAIGAWLLRRPPKDAADVARACALGLLAAIVLMPSTRFGYLLYPAAFAAWVPCLKGLGQQEAEPARA